MATDRQRLAANAWGAVLQVHAALVPSLDRSLQQQAHLPLTWYDVLLELAAERTGRLRMSDLADRVVLSRTRVSRLVEELASEGLVRKDESDSDRRSTLAVITEEGRRRFRKAAPIYLGAIEQQFAATLTDQELALIGEALIRARGSEGQRTATEVSDRK